MRSSIRKFLLINLLIAITVTTTLTAIGNYYLDQKDIEEHLDTLMAVSTLSYEALLGNDLHQRPLQIIQEQLNSIPSVITKYYQKNFLNDIPPQNYLNRFSFQVWTDNNKLLLHSAGAPKIHFKTQHYGFSDKIYKKELWRVFSTYKNSQGLATVLAEHYDTRNNLGHQIAEDDLFIMLLTFPLSGILIWMIIGSGLSSLRNIATEVANRDPHSLEPVNIKEVPDEIRPLIDELNKLFHRLQEGFEREKRFAADAAHELRTPLATLKAQAQIALNSEDIKEKNVALKKLITSINRSNHIIQQLLTISRLVPEAATINDVKNIQLPRLCREVLAMLAPSALEKQIDLEFEDVGSIPLIHGNETAISILITNLVDNAIRYCNARDKIFVRVYQQDLCIIFEVRDTGPGIPDELHARVFERFFRVLGTQTQGSGLGLSIVKQIIELHGGKIELDKPKSGTGLIIRTSFPFH